MVGRLDFDAENRRRQCLSSLRQYKLDQVPWVFSQLFRAPQEIATILDRPSRADNGRA